MEEEFKQWTATRDDGDSHYARQSKIIAETLSCATHSLNSLLDLMRREGEAALYLCGARLDNDFCLGSHDLGTAISVLPEDGDKAAIPGYHPGSTEVYVIFQGSLVMEQLRQGQVTATTHDQYDVAVIPAGRCHRVPCPPQQQAAASFIVKTNLRHKPGVVRCEACEYYPRHDECPLRARWLGERRPA